MRYGAKSSKILQDEPQRMLFVEPAVSWWRSLAGWVVFIVIMVALMLTSGCQSAPVERAERAAATGVNAYCLNIPYEVRSGIVRPRFAQTIAPNKAKIDCYGDPDNPRVPNDAQQ